MNEIQIDILVKPKKSSIGRACAMGGLVGEWMGRAGGKVSGWGFGRWVGRWVGG